MDKSLENLEVYKKALEVSGMSYQLFKKIPFKLQSTGYQFLNASDSIGANIAEGYGRGTFKDRKNFMMIARGSLYETFYWLSLLEERNLIDAHSINDYKTQLTHLARLIYGYTKYLKSKIP